MLKEKLTVCHYVAMIVVVWRNKNEIPLPESLTCSFMKTVLLFVLLSVLGLAGSVAQNMPVDTTNGRSYYILLKDGSHIHGRIIRSDSIMYVVKPRVGQVTFVEKALFQSISGTAPVSAADLTYYTQTEVTRPGQTTLSPNQYVISLSDGTTLSGQVLSQDSSRVVIKTTTIGTVYVPADRVLRMERGAVANSRDNRQEVQNGPYPNLFPQYMNFIPTAYQAEKGRAYFRNSSLYFSQFDVGLTDNWSAGVGFFTFLPSSFGWVSTKVSVPIGERARIGVQGQLFFGDRLFFDNQFSSGFVQGILSLGDSQNNVTLGLGLGTQRNSAAQLLTVGIVRRLRQSITFISENQLIFGQYNSNGGKLGAGVRFDRRRHSFDLSLNVPVNFGSGGLFSPLVLFPTASYQVRMGK